MHVCVRVGVRVCACVRRGWGGGGARQGEEGVHAYIHACMRIWVEMENCAYALLMSVHDALMVMARMALGGGGGGGGGQLGMLPS